MWKTFKVIDAEAHMHEPQYLWERYVETKYRDRVPKVAFMDGNFMVYEPDGKFVSKGEIQAAPTESARRAMEEKYGEAYRQWGRHRFACATWIALAGTFRCSCPPATTATSLTALR